MVPWLSQAGRNVDWSWGPAELDGGPGGGAHRGVQVVESPDALLERRNDACIAQLGKVVADGRLAEVRRPP